MRRITVCLLALLALPAAAADWLQEGHDAARTGRPEAEGPQWPDVALLVRLPVIDWDVSPPHVAPIVIDGVVYGSTATEDIILGGCGTLFPHVLWAQPLDGSPHEVLLEFSADRCAPPALASDGMNLFLAVDRTLMAYSIPEGRWTWEVPNTLDFGALSGPAELAAGTGFHGYQGCRLAVDGTRVVVACFLVAGGFGPRAFFVSAFNTSDGNRVVGPLIYDEHASRLVEGAQNTYVALDSLPEFGSPEHSISGLAVANGIVVVVTNFHEYAYTDFAETQRYALRTSRAWAVELDTGEDAWRRSLGNRIGVDPGAEDLPDAAPPVIVGDRVFLKAFALVRASLNGEEWVVSQNLRDAGDDYDDDRGAGCTALESDIVCGFSHRTYRLTPDFTVVWRSDLPSGQRWAPGGLANGGGRVYGVIETAGAHVSGEAPSGSRIVALDERTGEMLWTHPLTDGAFSGRLAIDGQAAVVLQPAGVLTVLGKTSVSPTLDLRTSSTYPAEGEMVRVSVSSAGGLAEATSYRADWGDGTTTAWHAEPVFEHRYSESVDHTARFFVRNDAGQTTSVPMTFHVGQQDPAMNILNSPFDDRYQETSFFFLGLLVTAVAAIFGLYRAGSKRRRLERELRHLQALKEEYGGDAEGLQARLSVRRQHIHGLYMDRKLEDGHLQVLEGRIDELSGRARLGRVEEECGFLPVSLARSLEGMLRDGRISSRERSTFLAAVEEHHALAPAEKGKVRKLVDEWFHHDAGGAA